MFSDQEIRTAMDGLVKQKGEDHIGLARYMDPMTGKGECFLGALCEYMNVAMPYEGMIAGKVLGEVSKDMATAFALAQYLNDNKFEWKYVLMGVDEVLAGNLGKDVIGCPCGCSSSMGMNQVVDKIKAKRALDKSKQGPLYPGVTGLSNGGIIKNSSVSGSLGTITFTIDGMTESVYSLNAAMNSFTNAFLQEGVVLKKDHALVA